MVFLNGNSLMESITFGQNIYCWSRPLESSIVIFFFFPSWFSDPVNYLMKASVIQDTRTSVSNLVKFTVKIAKDLMHLFTRKILIQHNTSCSSVKSGKGWQ